MLAENISLLLRTRSAKNEKRQVGSMPRLPAGDFRACARFSAPRKICRPPGEDLPANLRTQVALPQKRAAGLPGEQYHRALWGEPAGKSPGTKRLPIVSVLVVFPAYKRLHGLLR